MQNEIWKDIKDYEDLYQISNFGRIRSKDKMIRSKGSYLLKGKILSPYITYKGYLRIKLIKKGMKKNHSIHRLVAEAFIPNPENKPQVNHKDTNRKNNVVSNLEWATNSENQIHAYKYGNQNNDYKHRKAS